MFEKSFMHTSNREQWFQQGRYAVENNVISDSIRLGRLRGSSGFLSKVQTCGGMMARGMETPSPRFLVDSSASLGDLWSPRLLWDRTGDSGGFALLLLEHASRYAALHAPAEAGTGEKKNVFLGPCRLCLQESGSKEKFDNLANKIAAGVSKCEDSSLRLASKLRIFRKNVRRVLS